MRKRKVRGNNRRFKQLQNWIDSDRELDTELLRSNSYTYSKFAVYPWYGSSFYNWRFPQPNGKMKKDLVHGLLKIYESWKTELDKLEEPYYLKIWLFDPRISHSEIVCAIGEKISYYERLFETSESKIHLPQVSNCDLDQYSWEIKNDYDVHWEEELLEPRESYESEEAYNETVKFYKTLLNNKIPNTRKEFSNQNAFLVKKGNILIGGK